MTVLKNVELTDTLCAIMSRNTEHNQTDYAFDMHELLYGKHRHYLFMSHERGTLLVPEQSVYYRESWFHDQWLALIEKRPDLVRAFAVSVDRRMPGHVRGDVYLLDHKTHAIDLEINTVSVTDTQIDIREHLRDLYTARRNYKPISQTGYLKKLADNYMTRASLYHAGYRRICQADAYALLRENLMPVHLLSNGEAPKLLNQRYQQKTSEKDVFSIRMSDSADYDRWQRESLIAYHEKYMANERKMRREAR